MKLACLLGFLCAANAQPTLNMSQDLVRLGIAATNMVPNQPSQDSGPLFMQAVTYAKQHGIATVVADPGAYYFLSLADNTHVALSQINNMTIDLHGADLIFTHPRYYGIIVYSSSNAVLQNFTADYQPLPFTQVRVVAVDTANAQIQYTVEPGWQDPSAFNSLPGTAGGQPLIQVHTFRNGQPAFGTRRMRTQLPFTGDRFTLMPFTASATPAAVRPGDVLVLAMNEFPHPVNANHCNGFTFRNITVYSSVGPAVQAQSSQNTVLERIYSIPKPGTDRLVSAYGIALWLAGPNNQIRLSRAIRTMDDGFEFSGRFVGTVQSQLSSRSLTVVGAGNGPTVLSDGDTMPNSTPVAFQRVSDGVILGSAIALSQTAPTSSQPPQVTFNFDRDLPANLVGTYMYATDPNQNGANSVLERNAVENQTLCCRGSNLAGLANSAIRGNYFRRTAFAGIHLEQSTVSGEAFTAPFVNLNVSNNVIDGTNVTSDWWWFEFGAIQAVTLTNPSNFQLMTNSPFSNVNVTNNFIADSGRSAVWLGNTAGGAVSGNYILDPNARPDLTNAYQPKVADALVPLVIDTTSSGIATSNNTIDNTSTRMFVTDTQYRELAAYAPGSTIRLNAYNLGSLANPTITITDADGNTSPVAIQTKTAHALDVPLPAMIGLGGAYLTLTSGNVKYFGTLFLDSQDNISAVNGCTYESSLSSTSVPGTATGLPILVVTQAGCQYQAMDPDSFVSPGAGATGTAVITVGFASNPGAARNTTLEIAGRPFTLTQAAAVGRDVFLQFPDGSMGLWSLGGTGRQLPITAFSFLAGPSSGIKLVDVADLNRDGIQDLILRFSDGSSGVWYMGGAQGTTITGFAFISGAIQNWTVPVGIADLNGDGHADAIIQANDGSIGVWYLGGPQGNQITGFAPVSGPISGWKVVGMADLNNDSHPDAVIQYTDGSVGVWFLGGTGGNQITGFASIAGPSLWSVVGTVDMDGDGSPDLVIRNTDGTLGVWYLGGTQGSQITGFTPITTPGNTNWRELAAH